MNTPQVDSSHYRFLSYLTECRWASLWRQIDLCLRFKAEHVLEVGSGVGLFKRVLIDNQVRVTTADIAEDLKPDVVADVLDLPFEDNQFDLACAFQVLEHLPYEKFIPAVIELSRVAREAVLISLPDAAPGYPTKFSLPGLGIYDFIIPRLYLKKAHRFNGEHYWEINKKETPLKRIVQDIEQQGFRIRHNQRYAANMYHRFLVIE